MKWKIDAAPKDGEIRKRRIFAWRKTKVNDHWVWLETYQVTEIYRASSCGTQAWWHETNRDLLCY